MIRPITLNGVKGKFPKDKPRNIGGKAWIGFVCAFFMAFAALAQTEPVVYQAEDFSAQSGSGKATNHAGYTGTGFFDFGGNGSWGEWANIHSQAAGITTFDIVYANGSTANRQCAIRVNGVSLGNIAFEPTGAWATWKKVTVQVPLAVGPNTVRITANTEAGGPNVDRFEVKVIPTYRYLRLTVRDGVGPQKVTIGEINWLVGSEVLPKIRATEASTEVTAPQTDNQATAWRAYDGLADSPSSVFRPNNTTYPYSIILDLGPEEPIAPTAVQIAAELNERGLSSFSCEGSNDNSTWTSLFSKSGLTQSDWTSGAFKTFNFPDTQAPTAPTALVASDISRDAFTLSWQASLDNVGVSSYEVFAGTESKGTTTYTSLSITGLTCGTPYSFTVLARDAAGNVSAPSAPAPVTTSTCSGPPVPNTASLGMNLSSPRSWNAEFFFTNLAHHSLAWMPVETAPSFNVRIPVTDLTSDRYLKPGATGRLTIMWDLNPAFITPGEYVFTYEGTAEVALSSYSSTGITQVSYTPGRIVVNLASATSSRFLYFDVTSNSLTDPIKNIRFTELAREHSTDIFRPEFVNDYTSLKAFRFMDWAQVNNSTISKWEEYPADNALIQTGGVSYSYMIALANKANMDGWFCTPLLADDDFMRQLAVKIRDGLNPGLRAYIELSNEVWNGSFAATGQAAAKGRELGITTYTNNKQAAGVYYGYRTAQMGDIFQEEFAKAATRPALTTVVSWQAVDTWSFENMVIPGYRQVKGANAAPEAVAIAPYFGNSIGSTGNEAEVLTWTADMVLDQLLYNTYGDRISGSSITVAQSIANMSAYKSLVDKYSIPQYLAYEGGQHMVAVNNNSTLVGLLADANRNRKMFDAYMAYFDAWREIGGDLFATFSSTATYARSGSWGWKERPSHTRAQAPKYDAILTWNANNQLTSGSLTRVSDLKGEARPFGKNILVYPNPAQGSVTVKFDKTTGNRLKIYNITGKVFVDEIVEGEVKTLDLHLYAAGLYFFQVNGITRKILVQ
jgi:hypothetical protein